MDYTPIVLKNKGVPIEIAVVEKGEDNFWRRRFNEEGECVKETVYVRFTHNIIADLEERYGDLESWQRQSETRVTSVARDTIALCLRADKEKIGEAMLEGSIQEYQNAIAMSWSITNGVDPTVASKMLRQAAKLAEEQKKAVNDELEKQLPKESKPSRGKTGSASGPKQDEA
jgi:hypothetical protein